MKNVKWEGPWSGGSFHGYRRRGSFGGVTFDVRAGFNSSRAHASGHATLRPTEPIRGRVMFHRDGVGGGWAAAARLVVADFKSFVDPEWDADRR